MAFYIFKRCAQGTGIRRNCNLLSLESRVSVTIAIASYVYYPSLYYIDLLSSRSDMIK